MTPRSEPEATVRQFDELLAEIVTLQKSSKYSDLSDLDDSRVIRFITAARAAIHRIAGKPSVYVDQCEELMKTPDFIGERAKKVAGVLGALRDAVSKGYLASQTELLHGEVFGDFLEMAQHLLNEGYKDAAAVIAGSSLEAHLRQLCVKSNIPTETQSAPKKADRLNNELAGAQVYSKLDQKNVTAWLDLRNKAAHGLYGQYAAEQVMLLVSGIRDFLTRNPA